MPDKPLYLGIDLGGTNIQAGIVTAKGEVVSRDSTKTKAVDGDAAILKRIVKLIDGLLEDAKLRHDDIAAMGIGAPGAVNPKTGVVLKAVNLGWADYPLAEALTKKLPFPVFVDNDVNVGAWGEYKEGAGKKYDNLLAVFVGTGIGGGLVLNGDLFHGHHFTAGEIGHVVIDTDARLGQRTLENRASRTNIVNQLVALIKASHPSRITELCEGDYSRVRSKILAQAYQDDELTQQIIRQAAHDVGIAIANTVTLLSLPCVVLGGGLTEALGGAWVKQVQASFEKHVFPSSLRSCDILEGKLGDDAGVVGAALLARDRFE